jgi:hypothetical protein
MFTPPLLAYSSSPFAILCMMRDGGGKPGWEGTS